MHLEDDLFEAADPGVVLRQDLGLPALQFGIARVHAEQVGGEQPGLIASRPGADLDDDVAIVARIAGHEQRSQPPVEFLQPRRQLLHLGLGQSAQVRVFVRAQAAGLLELPLYRLVLAIGSHDRLEPGTLAPQLGHALRLGGGGRHLILQRLKPGGDSL